MDIINSELFTGANSKDTDKPQEIRKTGRSSRVGLVILVVLVLIALAVLWLAILN